MEAVQFSVAGSDYERNLLHVLKIIRDAGPEGVSKTQLLHSTRRLNGRDRQQILDHLTEGKYISFRSVKRARGPEAMVYVAENNWC